MDLNSITLPEVSSFGQIPRFYREDGQDYIEIGYVGSKDTNIAKVTPQHMAMFRNEWNAFCDGRHLEIRKGTPLTDVEGVNDRLAENFIKSNIHTAEELAILSDAQCQGVGHGTLTAREHARKLMALRATEREQATIKQMGVAAKSLQAGTPSPDVEALKTEVAELKNMVGDLVKALSAKPKRGRPPKAE